MLKPHNTAFCFAALPTPHKYSTQSMSSICLCLQVGVNKINAELRSLKPASRGALDPVSKLWPGHYGAEVQQSMMQVFPLLLMLCQHQVTQVLADSRRTALQIS